MNVGNALPGIFPVNAHVACWCSVSLPVGTCAHYTNLVAWTLGLLWPTTSVAPVPFPVDTRAHYTNSVAWTHGLLWPTTSVPGVPSTQYAYFTSHAPSRSIFSCTLQKVFAFVQHQQPNDILLVNLTHPLTIITLTPGSLGWDSPLLPIIRSHHAFHIHSIHTRAR